MTETNQDENNVNWTSRELEEWRKAGLVPEQLLKPDRDVELFNYVRSNIKVLHNHYRRNLDEDYFIMTVPPATEWHNAPDIPVYDKRTGQIVSVLEMAATFNLCEGICLQVKAKELPDWQQETADAKNLNKEQKKTLVKAFEKIGEEGRPLTRKEIVTLIEEIRKPQKSKTFRQSRELIDNKLDFKQNEQLTLFDFMENNETIYKSPLIKGLDLDQSEDRIIHTLTLLLSRKSETKNQKSGDYYMGNYGKGAMTIHNTEMETSRILVSPHEFYSTYYGKGDYGADQIEFLLKKLDSLSKKTFMTTWTIPSKRKGNNEQRFDKFRTNLPLFQLAILNQDLSESESQEIDNNKSLLEGKKCHFLFKFQPQFTNNIRERYVEFPENIHLRIAETAGTKRYSQCVNLMRDFLFREKQGRRYEVIRDQETLIDVLKLNKYWKNGKKKKVNDMINECLNIFIKIGLINTWEKLQGKFGQTQFRIEINPAFK